LGAAVKPSKNPLTLCLQNLGEKEKNTKKNHHTEAIKLQLLT